MKKYHFYTRHGFNIRESIVHDHFIKIDVEVNGEFVTAVESEASRAVAAAKLREFTLRHPISSGAGY